MKRISLFGAMALMSLALPVQGQTPTPPLGAPGAVATPPAGADPNPAPAVDAGSPGVTDPWAGGDDLDAERKRIWNSREMVAAREYIRQYSLRSRQFTPQQAEQYVAQLRQMSPESLTKWLEKFHVLQERRRQAEEVARTARQTAVEESLRRLQATHESYLAAGEGSNEAALNARNELARQQQFRESATAARRAGRNAFVSDALTNPYDWIINPDWYTKWAASASLPGDLPRSDPRNFIRGDVTEPIVDGGIEGPAGAAAAAAGANTAPPVPTPGG